MHVQFLPYSGVKLSPCKHKRFTLFLQTISYDFSVIENDLHIEPDRIFFINEKMNIPSAKYPICRGNDMKFNKIRINFFLNAMSKCDARGDGN